MILVGAVSASMATLFSLIALGVFFNHDKTIRKFCCEALLFLHNQIVKQENSSNMLYPIMLVEDLLWVFRAGFKRVFCLFEVSKIISFHTFPWSNLYKKVDQIRISMIFRNSKHLHRSLLKHLNLTTNICRDKCYSGLPHIGLGCYQYCYHSHQMAASS